MQPALLISGTIRHYEGRPAPNQPMQTGARYANDADWTEHAQPRKSEACHSCDVSACRGKRPWSSNHAHRRQADHRLSRRRSVSVAGRDRRRRRPRLRRATKQADAGKIRRRSMNFADRTPNGKPCWMWTNLPRGEPGLDLDLDKDAARCGSARDIEPFA